MTPNYKTSLRWTLGALGISVLLHAAAAQSVVVPAQYISREAPNAVFWALSPFDARRQLLIEGR